MIVTKSTAELDAMAEAGDLLVKVHELITSMVRVGVTPLELDRAAEEMIRAGGGTARLTTVQGGTLTASMMGGRVMLTDGAGGMAHVTQADVFQSNGVIHVVDQVLLPG